VPAGESPVLIPIINPPFADTAGIYAHPTPENRRKAVEVLTTIMTEEMQKKNCL